MIPGAIAPRDHREAHVAGRAACERWLRELGDDHRVDDPALEAAAMDAAEEEWRERQSVADVALLRQWRRGWESRMEESDSEREARDS